MNDIDDTEQGGLIERIKASPRTVSALIIILIVAAAIYAFSGDNNQPATGEGDQAAVTTNEETVSPETTAAAEPSDETATTPVASPTAVTQEELAQESKTLPEARKTDSAYVEVAQAGDGVTHVSRRAVTRWLSENQAGYAVTNEHRIFIEDYLKDKMGSKGLSVGAEQTISFDLIKEAVAAAQQLNDGQLHNLSQYTYVLT